MPIIPQSVSVNLGGKTVGGTVSVNGYDSNVSRTATIEVINAGFIDDSQEVTVMQNGGYRIVGPITKVSGSERKATIEVVDRTVYGMYPYRILHPFTVPRAQTVQHAIQRLCAKMGVSLSGDVRRRLRDPFSVERGAEPWLVARELAARNNLKLFMGADGTAILRRHGDGVTLTPLSEVKTAHNSLFKISCVEVKGQSACGDVYYGRAGGLDSNGRCALFTIEDADVESHADARSLAIETLADKQAEDTIVDADFTAVPVDANPGDRAHPTTGAAFILDTFSYTIDGVSPMTIGAHKRHPIRRRGRA